MRTIIRYECDICRSIHVEREHAEACEAKGRPDLTQYPQGLIHGDASKGFYEGITFVVANVKVARDNPHWIDGSLWAFRDNSAGDSLGLDDLCGPSGYFSLDKHDIPCRQHPTFARAVAFLKKHNITPTVWDGKKAVKL